MLKIKDDVDLKELEKFGFIHETRIYVKTIVREYDEDYILRHTKDIYIDESTKEISFQKSLFNTDEELDTLYDLIQAGLVEKVEG